MAHVNTLFLCMRANKSRFLDTGITSLALWCCNKLHSKAILHVSPESGLADELLDIRASGLQSGQRVVLHGRVESECGRFGFESDALYEADCNGEVTVSRQASLRGTYTGVDPMGPLWSMVPDQASAVKKARLLKLDPCKPLVYKFDLIDGEGELGPGDATRDIISSKVVTRHYVSQGIETTPVEYGSAQGILYIPRREKGAAPTLPFIIDFSGLGPSSPEDKPPLLASHGFAVFSVDYFSSLRDELYSGNTAYFDCRLFYDIVEFVKDHPRLDADRIGINGSCYGATLALNAVSRLADLPIRCMVLQRNVDLLATNVGLQMPDGSLIGPAQPATSYSHIEPAEDELMWFKFDSDHYVFQETTDESYIAPTQNISFPISLLVCGDDRMPTEKCMDRMVKRLADAGKHHLMDYTYLPGAGHLLDTPNMPLCTESRVYMPQATTAIFTKWGGEPAQHAKAQITSWKKMINFFRTHLGPMNMQRRDWLNKMAP